MLAANRAVAKALEQRGPARSTASTQPPTRAASRSSARCSTRSVCPTPGDLEQPGATRGDAARRARPSSTEERIHLATLRSMSQARYEARSTRPFRAPVPALPPLHVADPALCGPRRAPQPEAVAARGAADVGRGRAAGGGARGARDLVVGARAGGRRGRAGGHRLRVLRAARGARGGELRGRGHRVGVHGLFVRLARPAASGLVPLGRLDRSWRLDEEAEALTDERAGRRIEVGTRLQVRLVHVDDDRGRMAFTLAGPCLTIGRTPRLGREARTCDRPRTKGPPTRVERVESGLE